MRLIGFSCDASSVRNTGKSACMKKLGTWVGGIPIPKGTTFTAAELADFANSLQDLLVADNYDSRGFIIGPFVDNTMAYGDKTVVTNADRSENIVGPSTAGWDSIIKDGGSCYMRAVRSFDGREDAFDWLIIGKGERGHTIGGTEYYNTTTGLYEMAGLDLSKMEAGTPMVGEFADVDRYPFSIRLDDADQLFKRGMVVDTTLNIFRDLYSINDVTMTQLGAINGTGVVSVGLLAGCGAINLATGSNAATWANVARFVVKNATTGAAITVSAVTISNDNFSIDLDHTDVDYPTSGNYLTIELAAVSTLAAAGLEYYEGYANNPALGIEGKKLYIQIP